jgi:RNA polymerase sigma factor (sigma-70 family)
VSVANQRTANVQTVRGRIGVMREPREILPDEIADFLHADSPARREAAWTSFLAQHNRLLLRVAYAVAPNHEDAMDAYALVLGQLRETNGHRLRAYAADGRSKFTTWLVVVARSICVDFIRHKYGRYSANGNADGDLDRAARRSLAQLLDDRTDIGLIADENAAAPDEPLRSHELRSRLDEAMATISDDDRLLLKLRFDDDLSASAISKLVGLPTPFHVYRRLNALLRRLRDHLAQRGVESAQP